mgnify:CR=1 FL=1
MSEVRVNNIVDFGGKGAPTFDNGAVISGVSSLGNQAKIGGNVTITSGGINVSGVTTAATLSGNLTGDVNAGFLTATSTVIGSGVTINAGGLNITGVVTATSFTGDGSTMTGVAMSISPLAYNPDVNDGIVTTGTGIGITFDHRILAGSGNVTLSIATNAGAAGTTVENFGVGSSVTIAGRKATIDPTSDLTAGETYHISYPSGAFTNTGGDVSYVGTAYTFGVKPYFGFLYSLGNNANGQLGLNNTTSYSSPIQIPGSTWKRVNGSMGGYGQVMLGSKSDNTLWGWGRNSQGGLAQNNTTSYSSPVQIPGTTWSHNFSMGLLCGMGVKTDGTLWSWGYGDHGNLGHNESGSSSRKSSPVQVGSSSDWSTEEDRCAMGGNATMGGSCVKTDGTLWVWGSNTYGMLGQNDRTQRSSPVQIPGTTWGYVSKPYHSFGAIKTDGTLWCWGKDTKGSLGVNGGDGVHLSSPTQVPGTTWRKVVSGNYGCLATKTDGTLWYWGTNGFGSAGKNQPMGPGGLNSRSSPTQITSGTDWNDIALSMWTRYASKTDGTLYGWGRGDGGSLFATGINNANRSSPTQLHGGATDFTGSLSACYSRSLFNLRSS